MAKAANPPDEEGPRKRSAYDRHKARTAQRQRDQSEAGRDIGTIPPVADQARRDEGGKSFRRFLETYFPERFPLAWSPDHLKVIARVESTVHEGGRFALAMPRGAGKTTILEVAALWAVLYGYHAFVVIIGATGPLARGMLTSIKTELESNDILAADFPEVCGPVRELEGKAQRCSGQTHQGHRTLIKWRGDFIVLPIIPGSACSEAVIQAFPLLGSLRGVKWTRADGTIIRPSLVIIDDPQTDESSHSPGQCKRRLSVLNGAVLKLAGPGKKISAVCPCTVIAKGDMADKLLDREINPHWHGERCKTLYAFPVKMDLWKQYAVLRAESMRAGGRGIEATEFYAIHRAEMDEGAEVAWPQRFEPDHLSALESAMVQFFEDRYSFFAEAQNDPQDEAEAAGDLKPADIVTRFSGRARGVVPLWADKLTGFIDVQGSLLYYLVAAWRSSDFTGSVVAYGTWPEQPGRRYFTLADAQHTLQTSFPGVGTEAQIRAGLDALTASLLGREWAREDGAALKVGRLLVDSGFEMDVVFEACRSSPHAATIMPSRGQPIGVKSKPMSEYNAGPGDRKGFHWFIGAQAGNKRALRWVRVDTNFWKSFVAGRLRQPVGSPGALTLFGSSRSDADHDMLADQLCSERGTLVRTDAREMVEWDLLPGRPDNHFWDAAVGAACAASVEGVTLAGQQGQPAPARKAAAGTAEAAAKREEFRRKMGY